MKDSVFIDSAVESGFTIQQAEFMEEMLAKYPHTHCVDEIVGIEDFVEESVSEFVGEDGAITDEDEDESEDEE